MSKKNYYAVRIGREPGIYQSWEDCRRQVIGFPNAAFKGFATLEEAQHFLNGSPQEAAPDMADETGGGFSALTTGGETEELPLEVYVDGSFNAATGEYGSGLVILAGGEEICLSEKGSDPELASMRNVAGEIKASEAAMRYAQEHGATALIIYHDYQGIASWCTGEWKTNKNGTKAYKAVYDRLKTQLDIRFVKVTGHSGDYYNDRADRLAKQAVGIES